MGGLRLERVEDGGVVCEAKVVSYLAALTL